MRLANAETEEDMRHLQIENFRGGAVFQVLILLILL